MSGLRKLAALAASMFPAPGLMAGERIGRRRIIVRTIGVVTHHHTARAIPKTTTSTLKRAEYVDRSRYTGAILRQLEKERGISRRREAR